MPELINFHQWGGYCNRYARENSECFISQVNQHLSINDQLESVDEHFLRGLLTVCHEVVYENGLLSTPMSPNHATNVLARYTLGVSAKVIGSSFLPPRPTHEIVNLLTELSFAVAWGLLKVDKTALAT